jgi:hypothetical protein
MCSRIGVVRTFFRTPGDLDPAAERSVSAGRGNHDNREKMGGKPILQVDGGGIRGDEENGPDEVTLAAAAGVPPGASPASFASSFAEVPGSSLDSACAPSYAHGARAGGRPCPGTRSSARYQPSIRMDCVHPEGSIPSITFRSGSVMSGNSPLNVGSGKIHVLYEEAVQVRTAS